MRPNPLLLLLSLSAFGLAVSASANVPRPGKGVADPPAVPQQPLGKIGFPDDGPPAALESTQRLALARKFDPKFGKLVVDVPQVLEMRLTPARSVLENGAKIGLASGIDFTGPTVKTPNGAYWLSGKATDWSAVTPTASSIIEISVPTEVGKYYAIDCRVREYDVLPNKYSEASFDLTLGGVKKPVTSEGGHLIAATKATTSTTTFAIEYRDALARPFHAMAFWGCDVGKAG